MVSKYFMAMVAKALISSGLSFLARDLFNSVMAFLRTFASERPIISAAVRAIARRLVAGGDRPPAQHLVERLVWFLVRPGGFDGSGGRGMSPESVQSLSFAQACFYAGELRPAAGSRSGGGLTAKQAIDAKWHDPEFRARYSQMVADEKAKARERLPK